MPCSTNFQEYEVASHQSVAYAGCMDVITEEIKMILEVVTTCNPRIYEVRINWGFIKVL
jgi:hypothetical protein